MSFPRAAKTDMADFRGKREPEKPLENLMFCLQKDTKLSLHSKNKKYF